MKTNKSYSQRLKVTKTGKILARQAGQNHFRSRKTQEAKLTKKGWQPLNITRKVISRFLPGSGSKIK